jgi:hypothetical protein
MITTRLLHHAALIALFGMVTAMITEVILRTRL